jgi:hypothetical protein
MACRNRFQRGDAERRAASVAEHDNSTACLLMWFLENSFANTDKAKDFSPFSNTYSSLSYHLNSFTTLIPIFIEIRKTPQAVNSANVRA